MILGLACFTTASASDADFQRYSSQYDPELQEALRQSEMEHEFQVALRNSLEQQKRSDIDDRDFQEAILLSLASNKENVVKEQKIQSEDQEIGSALLIEAGKVINQLLIEIQEKCDAYKIVVRKIHDHQMDEQTFIDKEIYHQYLSTLERMEMSRTRLYNIYIKPEIDKIDKVQLLMEKIVGLTKEKAEELLEMMGI